VPRATTRARSTPSRSVSREPGHADDHGDLQGQEVEGPGNLHAQQGSCRTTLTGAVLAPTASLATLQRKNFLGRMLARLIPGAYAQSSGLVPVPNVTISSSHRRQRPADVHHADCEHHGRRSGNYSLTLPPGTNLGSNLLIQASNSPTPAPVGSAGQQSCRQRGPPRPVTDFGICERAR